MVDIDYSRAMSKRDKAWAHDEAKSMADLLRFIYKRSKRAKSSTSPIMTELGHAGVDLNWHVLRSGKSTRQDTTGQDNAGQ
eukprot:11414221-Alexandrium_andersonii.AAC.1